jgi:hypothetical protein
MRVAVIRMFVLSSGAAGGGMCGIVTVPIIRNRKTGSPISADAIGLTGSLRSGGAAGGRCGGGLRLAGGVGRGWAMRSYEWASKLTGIAKGRGEGG